MKCIWCRKREATQDMYCEQCNAALTEVQKAFMADTFEAACWRLAKSILELKKAIRADLPRWLKWLVSV